MVLDLLDPQTLGRLIGVLTLMIMAGAVGYAKGFKEGRREGYARGKAISAHAVLNGLKSRKAVK
jgi:hypothetical protein